jgi:hypothetical protein
VQALLVMVTVVVWAAAANGNSMTNMNVIAARIPASCPAGIIARMTQGFATLQLLNLIFCRIAHLS